MVHLKELLDVHGYVEGVDYKVVDGIIHYLQLETWNEKN